MTYQKTGIRNPESPLRELVCTLTSLLEVEAEVEYHICAMQEIKNDGDRKYIEEEVLSARLLNVDRVQGGPFFDAHDKALNLIRRYETTQSFDILLGIYMDRRADCVALKRKITALPQPYRWIITAKYIDRQKDTQICKQLKHGRTRFYHILEEGLRLLLREIDEEGLNLFLKENYFQKSEQCEQSEQCEH